MNICTIFCGNNCLDISVWTKLVDQQTDNTRKPFRNIYFLDYFVCLHSYQNWRINQSTIFAALFWTKAFHTSISINIKPCTSCQRKLLNTQLLYKWGYCTGQKCRDQHKPYPEGCFWIFLRLKRVFCSFQHSFCVCTSRKSYIMQLK